MTVTATVVEPATEAEVAGVLRAATAAGQTVMVRGGGTRESWGGEVQPADVVLSTRRLDALVEHAPGDLVCVAGAGMRLTALQDALAATAGHRQRLMLDPPNPSGEATLGGTVATGASGRLRPRFGTVRDLLIGVRFVLADGTIGHAGGKVVKNVAGYDLGKLLTASLGTLAVITQVTFRLHPLAEASHIVTVATPTPAESAAAVARLRGLPLSPSCVDILWPEGRCALQFDGSAAGARHQAELAARELGGRMLDTPEGAAFARDLEARPWSGDGAVVGIAAPRRNLAALLEVAAAHSAEVVVRGALAVGEARIAADGARFAALHAGVAALGGHALLHRAAGIRPAVAPTIDPVSLDLMRSVKRALDPAGTLGTGRLFGLV